MKKLRTRIAVAVGASTLVGVTIALVVFAFWHREHTRALHAAELSSRAFQILELSRRDPRMASQLARHRGISVWIQSADGRAHFGDLNVEVNEQAPGGFHTEEGYLRYHFDSPQSQLRLWAARSSYDTLAVVYRSLWQALGIGLVATLVVVILGTWLLQRAVVSPLHRIAGHLDTGNLPALSSLMISGDDMSRLSHGIVSMNRQLQEDRDQIKNQLEELKEAHHALKQTQAQLVRAERLAVVGQLAAGVAHEVGNPLAILKGFVDLLQGDTTPEERSSALGRMSKEINRIQRTVRGLLDFSRTPSQQDTKGSVREALTHVQQLLTPQETFRDLDFAMQLPDGDVQVPMGTDDLTQVVLNILMNAADALQGKGKVRVVLHHEEDNIVLLVEDDGPGIAPEEQARVFEPFYTTKPAGEGTGLGLSVCERMVSNVGGSLTIERSELGGALFRIELPTVSVPA